MGENDLAKTFRELEEAVEKLLKGRQGRPEITGLSTPPISGKNDFENVETFDGAVDREALELIRRAVKRLKSLY